MYSHVKQSSSSFYEKLGVIFYLFPYVILTKYTQKSGISWKLSRGILSFPM